MSGISAGIDITIKNWVKLSNFNLMLLLFEAGKILKL
jgi:hypothetical protein